MDLLTNLSNNCYRQQRKVKAFDPVSVDYVDIVDDWVVDTPALFSGPVEQPNWMEINQSVSGITPKEPNEDEFESFIEGTTSKCEMCHVFPFAGSDRIKAQY